jgi:hypothetical protein
MGNGAGDRARVTFPGGKDPLPVRSAPRRVGNGFDERGTGVDEWGMRTAAGPFEATGVREDVGLFEN